MSGKNEWDPKTMQRKPVEVPFELTLDRIAMRYHVLPTEVEKMDLDWIEIVVAIMNTEAEEELKARNQSRVNEKLKQATRSRK